MPAFIVFSEARRVLVDIRYRKNGDYFFDTNGIVNSWEAETSAEMVILFIQVRHRGGLR